MGGTFGADASPGRPIEEDAMPLGRIGPTHRGAEGGAGSARAARALALLASAAMLVGCAQIAPETGWKPPEWPDASGSHLVPVRTGASGNAGREDAGSGSDGAGSDGPAGDGGSAEGTGIGSPVDTAGGDLGFIERRVRNDHSRLQARYVEIPGRNAFNDRVAGLIREAVDATGATFSPEVFPVSAGLSRAGCVPGSAGLPAAQVLSDPETGPPDGTGTAVVCEVAAAFGGYAGVTMRTVSGGPDEVKRDELVTLYADIENGEVHEAKDLWTPDAADGLWHRAVELLRREAGGLSRAPASAPDDAQLALARRALGTVRFGEGGVRFT
ncbi:MAG: hypothetical protein QM606_00945, partial [Leucobacter sp.]